MPKVASLTGLCLAHEKHLRISHFTLGAKARPSEAALTIGVIGNSALTDFRVGIRLLAAVTLPFLDVSLVAVLCFRILSAEIHFTFLQEVMLENLSLDMGGEGSILLFSLNP